MLVSARPTRSRSARGSHIVYQSLTSMCAQAIWNPFLIGHSRPKRSSDSSCSYHVSAVSCRHAVHIFQVFAVRAGHLLHFLDLMLPPLRING